MTGKLVWVCAALAVGCKQPPEAVEMVRGPKRILFGDLHAHSSYSTDALLLQSSFLGGGGSRPPEVLCDFARFCSRLDFWSINDHPEGMLPELWRRTKEAIRTCNRIEGGYGHDPSLVSFLGWEWTQDAESPAACYGHMNVILRDTDDDKVPARSIGAPGSLAIVDPMFVEGGVALLQTQDPENSEVYKQMGDQIIAGVKTPLCPSGVDTRELPADCREVAADPRELFDKLSRWGTEALIIPHGNAWGWRHPWLSAWDNQLSSTQHDPSYQRLIEVFSGHGSSEVYRDWRSATSGTGGKLGCPEPTKDYLPCCWQAGEIVRSRAKACAGDPKSSPCEAEVAAAREKFLELPFGKRWASVGATTAKDWLDCGQCRDCTQPAYLYRPGSSVQASLALSRSKVSFRWGVIGSTDSHRAGPGAGYKELPEMADSIGPAKPELEAAFKALVPVFYPEWERMSSFMYTGALAGVHAEGRSREAIWQALKRRETYATSGERIELWFDLINGPGGERIPMGGESRLQATPLFEVKVVGSFKQKPGCPEDVKRRAPDGFLKRYCFGECYHPTDQRYRIRRVEVVKIEPQSRPDDDIGQLIQDPYQSLTCPSDPKGCVVQFADPDFMARNRPAVYYVRAFQEPTLQYNAGGLRCEKGPGGSCQTTNPCPTGYWAKDDTCMALDEELAWSSPIFLTP
jgi:hypothetical protein